MNEGLNAQSTFPSNWNTQMHLLEWTSMSSWFLGLFSFFSFFSPLFYLTGPRMLLRWGKIEVFENLWLFFRIYPQIDTFRKFNSNLASCMNPSSITPCSPPLLSCWVNKIGSVIFLLQILISSLKAQHVVLNTCWVPNICWRANCQEEGTWVVAFVL